MIFLRDTKVTFAALSVACVGLVSACMPSQYAALAATPESFDKWYEACANEADPMRRARFCDLAAESGYANDDEYIWALESAGNAYYEQSKYTEAGTAYQSAIKAGATGDVYGNMAYTLERLRDFEGALDYYSQAYRQTNDAEYLNEAGLLEEAMRTATFYYIVFEGFACSAVQTDSVLYPANEVIIQVYTADTEGYAGVVQLPIRNRYFGNVKAGYNSQRLKQNVIRENVFFASAVSPTTLSVTMWEYDDGGPMVDGAVMFAELLALKKAAPNVGARSITGAKVSLPPGQATSASPSPSPVHNIVSSAIKGVLGTSNDFMGTDDVMGIVAADLWEAGPKSEKGFTYHLKTRHRAKGANCAAYFSINPHAEDLAVYEQRVLDYIDARVG